MLQYLEIKPDRCNQKQTNTSNNSIRKKSDTLSGKLFRNLFGKLMDIGFGLGEGWGFYH